MNMDRQLPGGMGRPPTGLEIRPHASAVRVGFRCDSLPYFRGD